MKIINEIKKGLIQAFTIITVIGFFGITYAAFQNINQVSNTDILTASDFNKLITNQEDLKSRLDNLNFNEKQLATAWVNFNGINCNTNGNECYIRNKFNITKVVNRTDLGTSVYEVFGNFQNNTYIVNGITNNSNNYISLGDDDYPNRTNSSFIVRTNERDGSLEQSSYINISVFGG